MISNSDFINNNMLSVRTTTIKSIQILHPVELHKVVFNITDMNFSRIMFLESSLSLHVGPDDL